MSLRQERCRYVGGYPTKLSASLWRFCLPARPIFTVPTIKSLAVEAAEKSTNHPLIWVKSVGFWTTARLLHHGLTSVIVLRVVKSFKILAGWRVWSTKRRVFGKINMTLKSLKVQRTTSQSELFKLSFKPTWSLSCCISPLKVPYSAKLPILMFSDVTLGLWSGSELPRNKKSPLCWFHLVFGPLHF